MLPVIWKEPGNGDGYLFVFYDDGDGALKAHRGEDLVWTTKTDRPREVLHVPVTDALCLRYDMSVIVLSAKDGLQRSELLTFMEATEEARMRLFEIADCLVTVIPRNADINQRLIDTRQRGEFAISGESQFFVYLNDKGYFPRVVDNVFTLSAKNEDPIINIRLSSNMYQRVRLIDVLPQKHMYLFHFEFTGSSQPGDDAFDQMPDIPCRQDDDMYIACRFDPKTNTVVERIHIANYLVNLTATSCFYQTPKTDLVKFDFTTLEHTKVGTVPSSCVYIIPSADEKRCVGMTFRGNDREYRDFPINYVDVDDLFGDIKNAAKPGLPPLANPQKE